MIAGRRVEGTTKGGRERLVTLDAGTVAVLRLHRAAQAAERLTEGTSSDLVFTRGLGEPVHPDTVSQLMPRLIAKHNAVTRGEALPPARLHDLRHVHATVLLMAGVPAHVVATRLGHADPSITLRVYAHVVQEDAARVADLFAATVEAGPDAAVSKGVSK